MTLTMMMVVMMMTMSMPTLTARTTRSLMQQ